MQCPHCNVPMHTFTEQNEPTCPELWEMSVCDECGYLTDKDGEELAFEYHKVVQGRPQ